MTSAFVKITALYDDIGFVFHLVNTLGLPDYCLKHRRLFDHGSTFLYILLMHYSC